MENLRPSVLYIDLAMPEPPIRDGVFVGVRLDLARADAGHRPEKAVSQPRGPEEKIEFVGMIYVSQVIWWNNDYYTVIKFVVEELNNLLQRHMIPISKTIVASLHEESYEFKAYLRLDRSSSVPWAKRGSKGGHYFSPNTGIDLHPNTHPQHNSPSRTSRTLNQHYNSRRTRHRAHSRGHGPRGRDRRSARQQVRGIPGVRQAASLQKDHHPTHNNMAKNPLRCALGNYRPNRDGVHIKRLNDSPLRTYPYDVALK
ncbi:hypothetical protein GGR54DRAFT_602227 [Hypoxylon sp. NC1633]|nr:hypothetical protein GGR54DRAFT_602227 [Hypoxylon sp. NC1633]